ncbi:putative uncharacterized protein [Methanoculleus sp. CAG:1088]|jgi:hypothetical protein|nr:putative uncharacterized protein [Methanoculleus sp. CAG:1088]
MIRNGILESSRAALVKVAGVGMFPGFIGMPFMQVTLPITRNSASAGPVNKVSSGVSPASDMPGMVEVRVLAIVQVKTPLFPHMRDMMSSAVFLSPCIPRDGGSSKVIVISP